MHSTVPTGSSVARRLYCGLKQMPYHSRMSTLTSAPTSMDVQLSPVLRQELLDLVSKRTSLVEHLDSLRTLVVGSSHGDFGFNPAFVPDSFNLCSISQDLRHSALLVEKICGQNPAIRNIVVFYSAFSAGHLREKTSETERCAALKEVFLLDSDYDDSEILAVHASIAGRLGTMRLERGFRGFIRTNGGPFFGEDYGADRRAGTHMKHNGRRAEDLHLVRLILAAQARGQKVLVVIPPARSDYKAALLRISADIFRSLHEISRFAFREPIRILDCFKDFSFNDAWFGDYDHLLPEGPGCAMLSTRILNNLGHPG